MTYQVVKASDVVQPSLTYQEFLFDIDDGEALKLILAEDPFMRMRNGTKRAEYRMVKARMSKQLAKHPSRVIFFSGYKRKDIRPIPLHFKITSIDQIRVEEIPDEEDRTFMTNQVNLNPVTLFLSQESICSCFEAL